MIHYDSWTPLPDSYYKTKHDPGQSIEHNVQLTSDQSHVHGQSSNEPELKPSNSRSPSPEEKPEKQRRQERQERQKRKLKIGACDLCRSRKIKCMRLEVEGIEQGTNSCIPCRASNVKCTNGYVPKRPGPQSTRASRSFSDSATNLTSPTAKERGKAPLIIPSSLTEEDFASSFLPAFFFEPDSTPTLNHQDTMNMTTSPIQNIHHTTLQSPKDQRSISFDLLQPATSSSSVLPKSLDEVAPRQTFLMVISFYLQHLYPLCPLVHQPTFSEDLLSRRDEVDVEFLIFVLSLTSFTLVQLPRSVVPAPWPFYRKLHRHCHQISKQMQNRRYESPKLIHLCTLYLDHIYLGSTGLNNAANAVFGEAIRLCYVIGVHDERPPDSTVNASRQPLPSSLIDRELRRRIFFLLYGSDKTIALIQDQPICLRDEDMHGVEIPLAVDDDMITATRAFSQPAHRGPSILSGFETISRLFVLLSGLLESFRRDQRRPPTCISEIQDRSKFVGDMLRRVKAVLDAMPEAMQTPSTSPRLKTKHLHYDQHSQDQSSSLAGAHFHWSSLPKNEYVTAPARLSLPELSAPKTGLSFEIDHSDDISQTTAHPFSLPFQQQTASQPPILSPFATMKVNILITETMIRFGINEYRELLNRLQEAHLGPNQTASSLDNDWETAAKEMVDTLQAMPLDSLVANGQSMIAKLLYLTSSLLNRSPSGSRGFQYLCNFLETLTRLTSNRNVDTGDESDHPDLLLQAA